MRHDWFMPEPGTILSVVHCSACGLPECLGRLIVDFCPQWQEAVARNARGEYLQIGGDAVCYDIVVAS